MREQGTLFEEKPYMAMPVRQPPPRAHYNDPSTSFQAAERARKSGMIGRQAMRVFCAVQRHPGATSRELASTIDALDRWAVARRLPELVRMGIVKQGEKRKCAIAGTMAVTWWPSSAKATEGKSQRTDGVRRVSNL